MEKKEAALWMVLAVALGLFIFSFTAIFVNGFRGYLLYPILLGIVNLAAFYVLRQ